MRERLVLALVGITVAVIALYGVPRAYFLAELVQRQEERKIERSVDLLAVVVAEREADRAPVTAEFLGRLLNEAESIEYVTAEGRRVRAGDPVDGNPADIVMTRPVAGGGQVTLARSGSLVDRRVSEALLPLVLIGLLLAVGSALIGVVLARSLARPFQQLAQAAGHLGHGRFDLLIPHYRVPEAEEIGEALRTAARQLDEMVRHEREFAVNASHQLRTPITALRLELEDLSLWPQTAPEVAEQLAVALAELDRLGTAVSELLDLARGSRLANAIDLDLAALTADTVRRWRRTLISAGRELVLAAPETVPAHLPPGPVAQVLDVLIENAAGHGTGTVTVDTADLGTHLRVRVADEGHPGFGQEVFRRGVSGYNSSGTGVGLAVAAELTEALGGHLSLDDSPHTRFVLMLPHPTTQH